MSQHPQNFPANVQVAFQGALGAYSHLAIRKSLRDIPHTTMPCKEFGDVFAAVNDNRCDFGMLPMENALTGSIHDNFDLFLNYPDVEIVAEYRLRIEHNLIGLPEADLADVQEVFSHIQGLLQCRGFLDCYPTWVRTPHFDTAGSVEYIAGIGDIHKAAIASSLAAEIYGMKILTPGIETNRQNFTRFALIRNKTGKHKDLVWSNVEKASLVFGLADRPGALLEALTLFATRGLDLKKIESRPIHGKPFEYMFYVDVSVVDKQDQLEKALAMLCLFNNTVRLLGVYPVEGD